MRILVRLVANDPRSTTCRNLRYMEELTQLTKPQFYTAMRVRDALPVRKVPDQENWRLGLMTSLMKIRMTSWG